MYARSAFFARELSGYVFAGFEFEINFFLLLPLFPDDIIREKQGQTVYVPCPVNKEKCGELHSLNWFKGDNRIAAMLLDDSNVTSVADGYEDR